uniref:Histone deacetylase interacting domain-containing protein n=1 Tax=Odontella aurita TaxID=265563 RepID=A0A7S4IGZ1_9STRA
MEAQRQAEQARVAQAQAQKQGQPPVHVQQQEAVKKGTVQQKSRIQSTPKPAQPPQPAPPPPPPPGTQKFIDMTKAPGSPEKSGQTSPSAAQRKRPFSPGSAHPPPPTIAALGPHIHPTQPEPAVYNAGVERQFFDAAKEALTSYSRDGGQAWAEFLKCLDMYAQEVLSKQEMLGFVEPLLGKRHAELFEEFKRILAAAGAPGAAAHHDDAWHSVPLSEIDFSRCRRCSPSYRALPRDYPAPPCSERSVVETAVLNDVWVSLPVGSEESYTFRHMRKNQYEEMLFRTEDERFEIDMVIDSNAATLRRLEPIAEEIEVLSKSELHTPGLDKGISAPKAGLAGKSFQYSLDCRILNTIHKNSISRIYGDSGPEMLSLLSKNPAIAVPIVVKRLRQKDHDFRAAREVLNRRWREIALVNYYKSLDHRSLTWRTTDKRATSTRTLIAEIKDRAANGGNEGEAAMSVRREKAKEEFGSFYEVTKGRFLNKKMDLTNLPRPSGTLFTPHLSLISEGDSWAQRDAYRILAFALERGSVSPGDKERCHRLWRDFLCHFFGLSITWLQAPAVAYTADATSSPSIVSNGEESGDDSSVGTDADDLDGEDIRMKEDRMKIRNGDIDDEEEGEGMSFLLDQQPIPPGALVSTVYGEGTVIKFRRVSSTYVVSLPFGITYLNPNAVLCTLLPTEGSNLTAQLRSADTETLAQPNDKLVIGTQSLYLFLRLHQVLVRRLNIAKDLAFKVSGDKTLRSHIEQLSSDGEPNAGRKRYDAYLGLVYALVEGGYSSSSQYANAAEGGKYEDRVRCLLGGGAYELATMDKLVSHILKNLQNMASDETFQALVEMYRRHAEAGSFKPGAFRQEAAYLSEGENMYAFQYCKIPKTDRNILHFEFLGSIAATEQEDIGPNLEALRKDTDIGMADVDEDMNHPPSTKRRRV